MQEKKLKWERDLFRSFIKKYEALNISYSTKPTVSIFNIT
jgi:hypothetical protein